MTASFSVKGTQLLALARTHARSIDASVARRASHFISMQRPGLVLLPDVIVMRSGLMSETIETLRHKMEAAALALNFEEAKRCRDIIGMLRGGATPAEADEADFAGLERQKPGAMGLGTSQQRMTPAASWKPPPRPDPMTSGQSTRGRRRKP